MVSDAVWERLTARRAFALRRAEFAAALQARPGATELEDLYLASAALAGEPAAHKELVALIHSCRGAAARLVAGDEALLDDVEQEVARAVLTGPAPKLAEFSATGPLAAWLRAALVRTALNTLQQRGRELPQEHVEDLLDRQGGVAAARLTDAEKVREAIRGALARLEPRQRTLLRLHHLGGVSLERLATMFQVHRATAARWLAQAREDVLAQTQRHLAEDLGLTPEEQRSLLSTVRSQLELSFRELL